MRKLFLTAIIVIVIAIWFVAGGTSVLRSAIAAGGKEPEPKAANAKQDGQQKSNVEELLGLEKRRQQLIEKESSLAAKDQELTRLSASLDARIKELNAAKKSFEDLLNAKKKKESELANAKYMKMFKLLKAMRPEEAAKIMDKLEEPVAIGLLEKYDQKTVLKLSKFISQPRLMKWIRENLEAGQ
jgi:flagellar protein FlbB